MASFMNKATPEEVGISSRDVISFIEAIKARGMHVHGYVMIRRNRVFAEGYFAPYKKESLHRMYSVSKSFVAGAIGLLAGEGRISLTDSVCKYFPDMVDENTHPFILEATIRDLLMMSSPHKGTTYNMDEDKEWLSSFFKKTPVKHPGTTFNYDTSATYVLDVLVERLTGKPFVDYLYEKVLSEIGCSDRMRCIKSPDGYSWGGSGVLATTNDLARYALLFMNGGKWNGKQLLPEWFVKEATAKQIDNNRCGFVDQFVETCGYGYYIWQTPFGSFSFLGMGDQLAMCFPKEDITVVMNCDTQGQFTYRTCIFELIDRYLLSRASSTVLTSDAPALTKLRMLEDSLAFAVFDGKPSSPTEEKISGKRYVIGENGASISEFTLSFDEDGGTISYKNPKGEKSFRFARCGFEVVEFPEYDYSGDTIGTPLGHGYKAAASGVWVDENTLSIRVDIIDDYNGNMTFTLAFKGEDCTVKIDVCAEGFLEEYICLKNATSTVK